ncbi:MAG: HepT-like ribonuclease domain-containing protein [Candidatus Helarchaeota archaeon]
MHNYFGVDIETVWLTANDDIPILKSEIERILNEI